MRSALVLALFAIASCTSVAPTGAPAGPARAAEALEPPANRFTVSLGGRTLSDDAFWEPLEEQGVFGLEFAREAPGNVIGWEVGLLGSAATESISGVDIDGTVGELYGGVRKTFGQGAVHPYLGAGLTFLSAELSSGPLSLSDESGGLYAHGGLGFDVTRGLRLGLDARIVTGTDLSILGASFDADYS